MMRLNPDATFDCLFMANHLQFPRSSFSVQEIHIFAYLACLLWLYRERAVSDWGYEFVSTELGAPFSREIDTALKELLERGYFRKIHDSVRLTELAEQALRDLSGLTINQERAECLHAACSSTAVFSVGMVNSALANEPDLMRAKALPSNRLLLEDSAQSKLYVQFDSLRKAVCQRSSDLRLPAVVWLTALYRFGEAEA
jgi:hypothetical protein